MEDSGCFWVKDTSRSLKMMVYSVSDVKGARGLPVVNIDTVNMPETVKQSMYKHRLNSSDRETLC